MNKSFNNVSKNYSKLIKHINCNFPNTKRITLIKRNNKQCYDLTYNLKDLQ